MNRLAMLAIVVTALAGCGGADQTAERGVDRQQVVVAKAAVTAEVKDEPLAVVVTPVVSPEFSREWIYPTAPRGGNPSTVDLRVVLVDADLSTDDVEVTVKKTSVDDVVTIEPTDPPLVWRITGKAAQLSWPPTFDDLPCVATFEVRVRRKAGGDVGRTTARLTVRDLGDVNGDGVVDTADKVEMNRFLLNIEPNFTEAELDFNCDGKVDTNDKLLLVQRINSGSVRIP